MNRLYAGKKKELTFNSWMVCCLSLQVFIYAMGTFLSFASRVVSKDHVGHMEKNALHEVWHDINTQSMSFALSPQLFWAVVGDRGGLMRGGALGCWSWSAQVRLLRKPARALVRPLWGQSSHPPLHIPITYYCCKKSHRVQEIVGSSTSQDEAQDEVNCSKGMSGTKSLFPELSSTGRCEILQSLGPCQGESMLSADHGWESPLMGMCATEGKLQKRVQKYVSS